MRTTMMNFVADLFQKTNSFIVKSNSAHLLGLLDSDNYPESWITEGREYGISRARSCTFNEEVPVF